MQFHYSQAEKQLKKEAISTLVINRVDCDVCYGMAAGLFYKFLVLHIVKLGVITI